MASRLIADKGVYRYKLINFKTKLNFKGTFF